MIASLLWRPSCNAANISGLFLNRHSNYIVRSNICVFYGTCLSVAWWSWGNNLSRRTLSGDRAHTTSEPCIFPKFDIGRRYGVRAQWLIWVGNRLWPPCNILHSPAISLVCMRALVLDSNEEAQKKIIYAEVICSFKYTLQGIRVAVNRTPPGRTRACCWTKLQI